jgi:hypothetical protein
VREIAIAGAAAAAPGRGRRPDFTPQLIWLDENDEMFAYVARGPGDPQRRRGIDPGTAR